MFYSQNKEKLSHLLCGSWGGGGGGENKMALEGLTPKEESQVSCSSNCIRHNGCPLASPSGSSRAGRVLPGGGVESMVGQATPRASRRGWWSQEGDEAGY